MLRFLQLFVASLMLVAGPLYAQDYPNKPISVSRPIRSGRQLRFPLEIDRLQAHRGVEAAGCGGKPARAARATSQWMPCSEPSPTVTR